MRKSLVTEIALLLVFALVLPAATEAQSAETSADPPPIEQPLVREGSLAVRLAEALGLSTTTDEVEAESILGSAGISPRNGWIADYPVTPDIMGEVRQAVSDAAAENRLAMRSDEALRVFGSVASELGLTVVPYAPGDASERGPANYEKYPLPSDVDSHYSSQGPPVVTYYTPPPSYYYLYSWVPYPFWWHNIWFHGFFVLRDFHKVVVVKNRRVFVTNHFNHFRPHRVFRIDPLHRFHGRTFAGIGAPHRRTFLSTGVPRGAERIFNRGHDRPGTSIRPSSRGRGGPSPSMGGPAVRPHGGGSRPGASPHGGRGRR